MSQVANGRRVLVYDPDGVNPYGRELAGLLAAEVDTKSLIARDTPWVPAEVRARRYLPGNLGRSTRWAQAGALVRGLVAAVYESVAGRRVIIVVFTRSAIEDLVLASLARLGQSVIVVAHNPVPRTSVGSVRRRSQRALLAAATTVVVHSEALRRSFPPGITPRRVVRCSHPPFARWAMQPLLPCEGPDRADRRQFRVLFLGQFRPDKGIHLLPDILGQVEPEQRARMTLVVCGRGALPTGLVEEVSALGVPVQDRSSASFLGDDEIREALRGADVLLAPYIGATQSSTVIAALTLGVPVLAFDAGAIRDVVTGSGLVAAGDTQAMAVQLTLAARGLVPLGRTRIGLAQWRQLCQTEWLSALSSA